MARKRTSSKKPGSRKNYPFRYKKRYDRGREYAPLVGDFQSGQSSLEMIEYNYPREEGGIEEGIMGIPAWALLLGAVVVGGFILYRNRSGQ